MILNMNSEDGGRQVSLRLQPFASSSKVHDVVMETYQRLKKRKLDVQRGMMLYLANRDTEYILFKPIKVSIQLSISPYQAIALSLLPVYRRDNSIRFVVVLSRTRLCIFF